MPVCAAYNCHKRILKGTSLFKFPKNQCLCEKWLHCLKREDLYDFTYEDLKNGGFRVCQKHFEANDIYKKGDKTYLKKGALPTVHQMSNQEPVLKETPFPYSEDGTADLELNIGYIHPTEKKPFVLRKNKNREIKQIDNTPLVDINLVQYCSVAMCGNNSLSHPHLGFHPVPERSPNYIAPPNVYEFNGVWMKFLNTIMSLWGIKTTLLQRHKTIRICSIHFKEEHFIVPPSVDHPNRQVLLKATAFPDVDPLFESYIAQQQRILKETVAPKPVNTAVPLKKTYRKKKPSIKPKPGNTASAKRGPVLANFVTTKQSPDVNVPPVGQPMKLSNQGPFYLLPVVSAGQDNGQKMLLIPTDNAGPNNENNRTFVTVPLPQNKDAGVPAANITPSNHIKIHPKPLIKIDPKGGAVFIKGPMKAKINPSSSSGTPPPTNTNPVVYIKQVQKNPQVPQVSSTIAYPQVMKNIPLNIEVVPTSAISDTKAMSLVINSHKTIVATSLDDNAGLKTPVGPVTSPDVDVIREEVVESNENSLPTANKAGITIRLNNKRPASSGTFVKLNELLERKVFHGATSNELLERKVFHGATSNAHAPDDREPVAPTGELKVTKLKLNATPLTLAAKPLNDAGQKSPKRQKLDQKPPSPQPKPFVDPAKCKSIDLDLTCNERLSPIFIQSVGPLDSILSSSRTVSDRSPNNLKAVPTKRKAIAKRKPFSRCFCRFCDMPFAKTKRLYRHERKHSTFHNCRYCPKRFSNFRSLNSHIFCHWKGLPQKCRYCRKRLSRSDKSHCC